MVYIDSYNAPYRGMIMCHMASPNIEELHNMADAIGINRKWFQDVGKGTSFYHPHYDVCKSKKLLAIKLGATEVSDRELIKLCYVRESN